MKKNLLTFCLLVTAGFVSAQCNPQFTAMQNPAGNDLLRVAVTNNSVVPPAPGQSANYTLYSGVTLFTSNFPSGSTAYLNFATPGTYPIKLAQTIRTVINGNIICTDTLTKYVTLSYAPCATTLNYVKGSGGAVTFTASTVGGSTGMSYIWSFGDGTTGTGITTSHTYAGNGNYQVILTATGTNCSYSNQATVSVTNAPINCAGNHASFTSAISSNTVAFTNTSTTPSNFNTSQDFTWSFGDGSPNSMAESPVHAYSSTGTYSVYLVSTWLDSANNNLVCLDTARSTIVITQVVPPPNHLSGMITRRGLTLSGPRDVLRVWLIGYDSAANTLRAIDSVTTDSALTIGNTYQNNYYFNTVAAGSYLLKVARLGSLVGTTGPVPTYYDSSLYWNAAAALTVLPGGTTNNGGNITMQNGIANGGLGFIGGSVLFGANRGTATGLYGATILLRDQITRMVVRSAITDAAGKYSFSNVATGLYDVYPEELNYATTSLGNLAITNAQNNVTSVNFIADRNKKTIKPGTTGINQIRANGATVHLFPNPAKNAVTLSWTGFSTKEITVSILNITGQVVAFETANGAAGSVILDIAKLNAGVYMVRMHNESSQVVEKMIVQP